MKTFIITIGPDILAGYMAVDAFLHDHFEAEVRWIFIHDGDWDSENAVRLVLMRFPELEEKAEIHAVKDPPGSVQYSEIREAGGMESSGILLNLTSGNRTLDMSLKDFLEDRNPEVRYVDLES